MILYEMLLEVLNRVTANYFFNYVSRCASPRLSSIAVVFYYSGISIGVVIVV